ncbi:hypothetical protein ACVWXN_005235 [Bradyrhizobium sp. i1.4.4]
MSGQADRFYVSIMFFEDGKIKGHAYGNSLDKLLSSLEEGPEETKKTPESVVFPEPTSFVQVFDTLASTVQMYRDFLDFTILAAPMLSRMIASHRIAEFGKARGTKIEDVSNASRTVFEVGINAFREFHLLNEEIDAGFNGAKHLPEVMLIGLVSAYDAFLGKLLLVIFLRHQEMILTSDKSIKFSELSEYTSIEEARRSLISREIESVLRDSHTEHFKWMERKFSIKLREDLAAFPKFVELCERRNLMTHTGGVVTAQYLANCKEFGVDIKGVELGQKLSVSREYYASAVNVVCEIGIKLCYVLWRKFMKDERDVADDKLNLFCFDLIGRRKYATAETILSFSTKALSRAGSDRIRRMMFINLANAIRLQKRTEEANKLLDAEDWSSVSDDFQISVAAIREDVEQVVSLMQKIGRSGHPDADEYRSWPVFRGMRKDERFANAFQATFGEPLVLPRLTEVKVQKADEEATTGSAEETLH